MLALGGLIRPTRPQPEKYINYESGVDPVGSGWAQSQVRYYLFALLFVAFVYFVYVRPRARIDPHWQIPAQPQSLGQRRRRGQRGR